MIYFFSPFSFEKNLGRAYNHYCEIVPNDEDYICITDLDVMFLCTDIGKQLQDIVNLHKDKKIGVLTCFTNRIGNLDQAYQGILSEDPDIKNHRKIALALQQVHYSNIKPINSLLGGFLMLFQKKVWKESKFHEEEGKILGIDNKFGNRLMKKGYQNYIMQGVYVLHYYRLNEGRLSREHLK